MLISFRLALLPAVRVRADDPCPLQVDGVVVAQARHGVVFGVRVLQAQLIPVAERPRDVRRVGICDVVFVRGVLHVIKQETGAPLPAEFVGHVRVQSERADIAVELVAVARLAIGIELKSSYYRQMIRNMDWKEASSQAELALQPEAEEALRF